MDLWVAFRNSIGVVVPLVLGYLTDSPRAAMVSALAALVVSYSDGPDPYHVRARRMLASSVLCAAAVVAGSVSAQSIFSVLVLTMLWSFVAGLSTALEGNVAALGSVSLTMLVIFTARPVPLEQAFGFGALAMGGGLLQTAFALSLWPVHRYGPERHELGKLYIELSELAQASIRSIETPQGSSRSTRAQVFLSGLAQRNGLEADRYRLLLSQAERIRLRLFSLVRLRRRMRREPDFPGSEILVRFNAACSRILNLIGHVLLTRDAGGLEPACMQEIETAVRQMRALVSPDERTFMAAVARDSIKQMDALVGQFRAASDLATHSTPVGRTEFYLREARKPWWLRLTGTLVTIRANLTPRSVAFRHAVRLAVCMGVGCGLGQLLGLDRRYWVTLTIAVVLKPEVGGTIERAALRITGTLVGLFLASMIFRWISPEGPTAIVFIAGFTFLLRWAGAGNYGIFVVCISGIVVFLLDLSGVSARDAISARAMNTLLGGGLALLASYFWPIWERTKVSDAIARMLDAYREYFHSAAEVCSNGEVKPTEDLDQVRLASRVSRSNFQASMNRLDVEPGFSRERRLLLSSVQSSSNRLAHSLMALEAGGSHEFSPAGKEAFQIFARDVEKTLQLLSQFLRGAHIGPHDLPDLRQNFEAFIRTEESLEERHALVQSESDRITNSLNTLREQIGAWVGSV